MAGLQYHPRTPEGQSVEINKKSVKAKENI